MLARVVHGHGTATIDGEVHHLIEGHQLHGVELPVIDGLGTGREDWVTGDPPQARAMGVVVPSEQESGGRYL